jgi:uncharacterized protein (TIGR03437 family)
MERRRKLVIAKVTVVLGAIPLLIWAHASGPDVGKSGVPGESTCMEAGCHLGTPLNGGGGSVQVAFPFGLTYTPGVKQRLTVTVSDPTARVWGFQLTARQSSNARAMAGSFTSTDRFTAVVCGTTPTDGTEIFLDFGQNQNCPQTKPLAYAEHSQQGSSRIRSGSQTYEFEWTPPATDVGNISIYAAGNAANGNGNEMGDHIYTAPAYVLTPRAGGAAPAISANGVQNGASFEPGVVANSWITIKGTNLSATTNTWEKAIVDNRLPTSLDGVNVSVGGKPAYIYFVSATQINALAPDLGTGPMDVAVTNGNGTSQALTANASILMPALFQWPGSQAVATKLDGSWAVKNGTFTGTTTSPAKPGEVIILWTTGLGPTNPPTPVGVVSLLTVQYNVTNTVSVTVGGSPAEVIGAALSGGFAGLYQIAIRVPANAANGDLPVVATVGGAQSPAGVVLAVQR